MPERYRVYALLAKIEAVSGTDAAPTGAADAVRTIGLPEIKLSYLEDGNRQDVQSGVLGTVDRALPSGRLAELEVSLEAKGAGAAYSATVDPEWDPFIRMAGFSRAVTTTAGSEKILYTTIDDAMETGTVWCYTAKKLIKVVGCVAKLKLSAEANKRGIFTFSVIGRVVADPTESVIPALTLSAVNPPLFNSAAAAIGAWDGASGSPLVLRKADLNGNETVEARPSANAADGHAGYLITDRLMSQSMDAEVVPISQFDPFAMSKAAAAALPAATNWTIGTAQYNRVKVVTGRWALRAPDGPKNAGGLATWGLTGDLVQGTAATTNREVNITVD